MAKTYEALRKTNRPDSKIAYFSHPTSEWTCPDLSRTTELLKLWSFIDRSVRKDNSKVFNLVSSRSGEGTSTIVCNLARIFMNNKAVEDVLVIDANRGHPVLDLEFSTTPEPGLYDVLGDETSYSDAIFKVGESNVSIMPCGTRSALNPSEIGEESFSNLISRLHDQYRYILIDSPPILSSPDSIAFATGSDVTSLIIAANVTKWEVAEKAKRILEASHCVLGGIVLNSVRHVIPKWIYRKT